jgi:hypothetical protein
MQIERVNLKVQPIEHKRLYQPQHSFAKESIDPHLNRTLIQQTQNTRTEYKRNKGVCPLNPMLNVRRRKELETSLDPLWNKPKHRRPRPLKQQHRKLTKQIK